MNISRRRQLDGLRHRRAGHRIPPVAQDAVLRALRSQRRFEAEFQVVCDEDRTARAIGIDDLGIGAVGQSHAAHETERQDPRRKATNQPVHAAFTVPGALEGVKPYVCAAWL